MPIKNCKQIFKGRIPISAEDQGKVFLRWPAPNSLVETDREAPRFASFVKLLRDRPFMQWQQRPWQQIHLSTRFLDT